MSINPSQPKTPSVLRRYGVAGLCVLGSLLLRGLLDPMLGSLMPLSTTFGFVAVAVWYGGWGPALFAALMSYLGGSWLFIEPRFAFELTPAVLWGFAAYMSSMTVIITIGDAMRRAQERALMSVSTALGQQRVAEGQTAERKRAEEALLKSEERFRTLADHISQFAWMADATGWIFWYNQRWYDYTGTTLDAMQGWGWKDVHHPDHVERVETTWRQAHATGEPWEDTFPLRGRDGTYRWFLSRALPIRNADGRIDRWFGTNTDITQLRNIQASLRDSEEQLRSFSGQLEKLVQERTEELMQSQHRLRVLATELNLAEQRERKRLATELHDYLAQLLVVCRINLGHTKRIGLPTKADEILEETEGVLNKALNYCRTLMAELSPPVLQDHGLPAGLQWLGQQMQRHGLHVTVDLGEVTECTLPDDWTVLLFQSVRELLMNTLKHAAIDKVGICLAQYDGMLRIEVRDEGVGFDLAAALTATTTTEFSSKFGLFSINERMKALGGRFDVHSVPGHGTTATLILPIDDKDVASLKGERRASRVSTRTRIRTPTFSDAQGPLPTVGSPPEDSSGQKQPLIRLLLVDDHAMVRQGLRSVLESYSDIIVVGEASNGEEAVASAGLLQPAIVVMDINMPRMNGIEATAQIKARYPHIRVIGLSVQAGGANEAAMRNAGAEMLLTKETAVDQLYSAIQTTLSEA